MDFIQLLGRAAWRWYDRDGNGLAAALAYYTPFALAPLIFVSMTLLSLVYGTTYVVSTLLVWGQVLGPELLEMIQLATVNSRISANEYAVPMVGIIFFICMVIIAFNTLTSGFNHLWEIPHSGLWGWVKKCLRSFLFLFILQAYFIFMMGTEWLFSNQDFSYIPYLSYGVALSATTLLFYLMYRYLSHQPPSRAGCFLGALVGGLLLILAKSSISLYTATSSVPKFYDAAGLVLVLLIWIYGVASIIYYGATLAHEYDKMRS